MFMYTIYIIYNIHVHAFRIFIFDIIIYESFSSFYSSSTYCFFTITKIMKINFIRLILTLIEIEI